MSEEQRFFRELIEGRIGQIHTMMPAKVESYNESKGTARVVPLFMRKGERRKPLQSVPVLKHKYKDSDDNIKTEQLHLEKGDTVLVGFCERQIDDVELGVFSDPGEEIKHPLEAGIILGYLGW